MPTEESVFARISVERCLKEAGEFAVAPPLDIFAGGVCADSLQKRLPVGRIPGAQVHNLPAKHRVVVAPAEEQIEQVEDRRRGAAWALDTLEDRHGEGRDGLGPDDRIDI